MSKGWRAFSLQVSALWRSLLVVTSFVVSVEAHAQSAPAATASSPPNRNYQVTLSLFGYGGASVRKVSGTNAVFAGGASTVPVSYQGSPPAWDRAYLTKVDVEVGFQVRSWARASTDYPASKTFSVQWDTTSFSHAVLVPVKLRTTMKLERLAPPEPGAEPQVVESEEVSLDLNVTVQAWNKALVMGTREIANGNGGFVVPPQPVKPLYDYAAKQGVTDALPKFLSMNHAVDPVLVTDALNLTKDEFRVACQNSNVLYLFSHGFADSFRVSGLVQPDEENFVYTTDLADMVPTGDEFPEINLAIFYACNMLVGNDFGIATRVLTLSGQPRTNRAVIGFNSQVLSLCELGIQNGYEIANPTLDLHSAEVMQRLAGGETVADAVRLAYDMYEPLNSAFQPLYPTIAGDPYHRSTGLYTGSNSKTRETIKVVFL